MTSTGTKKPLQKILDDLQQYVEHEIDEGGVSIEVCGERLKTSSRQSSAPQTGAASPSEELNKIAAAVRTCAKCPLHKTRTKAVPGQGTFAPEIMFVGEAPGEDEDRQGLAFVGAAGQLLTRMIAAMGLSREEVFIGNILKCRPPGNRVPLPEEIETCLPYLKAQIAILKPKVIVALGATAVRGLMKIDTGITRLRGKWLSYEGIDLMPTFHPSYLLRAPSGKRDAWEDLKAVLAHLDRTPPPRTETRRGTQSSGQEPEE